MSWSPAARLHKDGYSAVGVAIVWVLDGDVVDLLRHLRPPAAASGRVGANTWFDGADGAAADGLTSASVECEAQSTRPTAIAVA